MFYLLPLHMSFNVEPSQSVQQTTPVQPVPTQQPPQQFSPAQQETQAKSSGCGCFGWWCFWWCLAVFVVFIVLTALWLYSAMRYVTGPVLDSFVATFTTDIPHVLPSISPIPPKYIKNMEKKIAEIENFFVTTGAAKIQLKDTVVNTLLHSGGIASYVVVSFTGDQAIVDFNIPLSMSGAVRMDSSLWQVGMHLARMVSPEAETMERVARGDMPWYIEPFISRVFTKFEGRYIQGQARFSGAINAAAETEKHVCITSGRINESQDILLFFSGINLLSGITMESWTWNQRRDRLTYARISGDTLVLEISPETSQ